LDPERVNAAWRRVSNKKRKEKRGSCKQRKRRITALLEEEKTGPQGERGKFRLCHLKLTWPRRLKKKRISLTGK